ncbi:MAG: hypothetical protein JWM00_140 [Candidatus Saccharibacteria bacterium]|nr:hypothetical protein [Candidatus Saccharibacteria bacterium]
MLKVCVQYVHNLFTVQWVKSVRLYTLVMRPISFISSQLGQLHVIPSRDQKFSAQLYTAKLSQLSLLENSYTRNPQSLLILSKKIKRI